MNTKLKKLIFLAAVMSIFSPYLIGRVHAEKEPQSDCELRRTETVVQTTSLYTTRQHSHFA
jgi:hypothetical protein